MSLKHRHGINVWHLILKRSFDELSLNDLYSILKLRSEIFVVEQCCVYQDMDNIDQECTHFYIKEKDEVIAYARILAPGLEYKEASLGRVVVKDTHRSKGLASQLTEACLDELSSKYPDSPIKIMAQVYLKEFYKKYGFKVISDEFREDQLPHVYLLKS